MNRMNYRGLKKLEQARVGLREALAVLEGEALDPWRQVVVTCRDFMTDAVVIFRVVPGEETNVSTKVQLKKNPVASFLQRRVQ